MLLAWPGIPGGKSYFINAWVGKNGRGGGGSIKMRGGENMSADYTQTKRSWGGGKKIIRFRLQYVIWWWQLVWTEEWGPISTTTLGWSVKIRSIEEDETANIWVGSDIKWSKPYIEVKELIWAPPGEVISSGHQPLDLVLKSPKIIVNDDLSWLIWFIGF